MDDSAPWKTEETIIGLSQLPVLSGVSRFGGCHVYALCHLYASDIRTALQLRRPGPLKLSPAFSNRRVAPRSIPSAAENSLVCYGGGTLELIQSQASFGSHPFILFRTSIMSRRSFVSIVVAIRLQISAGVSLVAISHVDSRKCHHFPMLCSAESRGV